MGDIDLENKKCEYTVHCIERGKEHRVKKVIQKLLRTISLGDTTINRWLNGRDKKSNIWWVRSSSVIQKHYHRLNN